MTTTRRAFIFDLDGVITDTAHLHFVAWQRLAQSQGLSFDETFNEKLKGVSRMDSLELILAQSSRSYTQEQKLALADNKNNFYVGLIDGITPADLLPGALHALKSVREAGCAVGLASASKNALSVLARLGITELFDHVVDANTVARGKPDPEVFLRAASALNCEPGNCIGVEDAIAGVQSIKAAGMYAIGIGSATELSQADYVLPNLKDFRPEFFLNKV
jgi:beta-phosphoglucomutase